MTEPRFLGGRYDLGEVLGHGGMAEVRIGIDRRLGRTVAVKTLRADLATDPTFQARFRREAQSAASLNHPAVVAVYDTGEEVVDGVRLPYIVMEYVEGRTLRDVLREGRRILPERALEITADILDALEYSHRAGIVHRDIKPGNVMLTPNGDVKVMDFGIARAVADASATMTQTAAVIGTAQYLSPEQARGESVDARSDIYSTGCLLYELLTGRPPFVGDSPVSVAYQHVREEPRPPSSLDPEVPPAADAITLKALQKKPADRYQSAAEMRQDIERALSGQRVAASVLPTDPTERFVPAEHASPPPPAEQTSQWAPEEEYDEPDRGRKLAWAMLIIAILFVLGVVTYILINSLGGGPDQTQPTPTLVGKTRAEAEQILADEGLKLGRVTEDASSTVPKGRIMDQSPDAGEQIRIGGSVDIVISLGPQERVVPNVVGMQVEEAERRLRSQGFKVKKEVDPTSDENEGVVTSTIPAVGSPVAEGATITLFYASGKVEVPRVIGMSEDEAREVLEEYGFDVAEVARETTEVAEGKVVYQEPKAGTLLERGATVTIHVAVEPEAEPTPTPTPTEEPTSTPTPTEEPTPTPTPTEEPTPTPTPTETEGPRPPPGPR
jgi:serine/threonine-protein kinase